MRNLIARLLKPFLRLLPLTQTRRRRTTPALSGERPSASPSAVLGVGLGSVGFPYEESNR